MEQLYLQVNIGSNTCEAYPICCWSGSVSQSHLLFMTQLPHLQERIWHHQKFIHSAKCHLKTYSMQMYRSSLEECMSLFMASQRSKLAGKVKFKTIVQMITSFSVRSTKNLHLVPKGLLISTFRHCKSAFRLSIQSSVFQQHTIHQSYFNLIKSYETAIISSVFDVLASGLIAFITLLFNKKKNLILSQQRKPSNLHRLYTTVVIEPTRHIKSVIFATLSLWKKN